MSIENGETSPRSTHTYLDWKLADAMVEEMKKRTPGLASRSNDPVEIRRLPPVRHLLIIQEIGRLGGQSFTREQHREHRRAADAFLERED